MQHSASRAERVYPEERRHVRREVEDHHFSDVLDLEELVEFERIEGKWYDNWLEETHQEIERDQWWEEEELVEVEARDLYSVDEEPLSCYGDWEEY